MILQNSWEDYWWVQWWCGLWQLPQVQGDRRAVHWIMGDSYRKEKRVGLSIVSMSDRYHNYKVILGCPLCPWVTVTTTTRWSWAVHCVHEWQLRQVQGDLGQSIVSMSDSYDKYKVILGCPIYSWVTATTSTSPLYPCVTAIVRNMRVGLSIVSMGDSYRKEKRAGLSIVSMGDSYRKEKRVGL